MTRTIISLAAVFLMWCIPDLVLCESVIAVGPAKAPADVGSSSSSAVSTEKSEKTGQLNKDGSVPAQVMEKLSNAVSSEYIIGAEDVLEITVWRNADLSKDRPSSSGWTSFYADHS